MRRAQRRRSRASDRRDDGACTGSEGRVDADRRPGARGEGVAAHQRLKDLLGDWIYGGYDDGATIDLARPACESPCPNVWHEMVDEGAPRAPDASEGEKHPPRPVPRPRSTLCERAKIPSVDLGGILVRA